MQRPARLGIVIPIVLAVVCGGFTAYWLIAAIQVKDSVLAWVQGERARNIDISWRTIRVTGFPLSFRVVLDRAVVRDRTLSPAPELRIPTLSGRAALWDFTAWRLDAPDGLAAGIAGAPGRPAIKVSARSATGTIQAAPARGTTTIAVRARNIAAEAGPHLAIGLADVRIALPAQPPRSHADPLVSLALRLQQLRLPEAIRPLGETIDDLSFRLTIDGVVPRGPLIRAITAWRNSGGTIELDHLNLHWGALAATGSGTLALDHNLQPIGGFSGAIEGYDEILTALVRNGRMRAKDAGLARLALALLAKAGPDGRPQIATSFTIQNGEMYLGPAKLGPAPRLAWD